MSIVKTSINPDISVLNVERSVTLATGGRKLVKPIMKSHQAIALDHLPTTRHYTFNNVPANLFNGVRYQANISKGSISTLGHMTLKIIVDVAGADAVLAPVPLWFQRCDIRTSTNNEVVATMYDDSCLFSIMSALKKGQTRALLKNINMDYDDEGYMGTANALAPGRHIFFLPLVTVFNGYDLYWKNAKSDLLFDLQPPNTIVSSGSGTVTCGGLQLICEAAELSPSDLAIYENNEKMYVKENIFLDPIRVPFTAQHLTAGSSNNLLDLTPLQGKCAFMVVYIRESGASTVKNTLMKCLNIGDNEGAGFDILDATGNSIYGMGSAIESKLLRNEHSVHHFDSDFLAHKAMYVLPFCTSIPNSYSGKINGFQQFDGEKLQLQLSLPPAPVKEVHTITSTAAPDAGFYRFDFRSETSEEIPYNATPAEMSAAFNKMKQAARLNITAEFSGSLSSGTSITATFTTPETAGLNGDPLDIFSNGLSAAGSPVSSKAVRSVAGTSGLATGLYDVTVYGYVFKRASYFNGTLLSRLI